ncbi:hypothetical protein GCM10010912_14700 [Paenibacillus albidus]|uniref:Uncharacterized protein n=1 Tax=Paenibacillus albidus TaxID=2041023 RepID=A0A917FFG0_9BACL|nr:hypothetical protein GCM10010912_14700 [Paenibacillus albidus]
MKRMLFTIYFGKSIEHDVSLISVYADYMKKAIENKQPVRCRRSF